MTERVEKCAFETYQAFLKDKYRPPSKGGNTKAWHQHVIKVGDENYSFLALGAAKWAYAGDLISFEWEWDQSQKYRNITTETFRAWNKKGESVVRGNRGSKPWRTADTRLPASRREQRD
ncbi:hypothetical protein FF100_04020 [Methylobacterium terricola]|uniref:Uncharacterized protein n=1 Tax=Methylobacterium terricola TaxID=2583531 RepID=A0A5C4LQD0_9HYPH|nr:hypothetical protein [Methylobacterium terricola]TNC16420.1 hypothetical protein FF100_04020 [Methylobacterium terricola]